MYYYYCYTTRHRKEDRLNYWTNVYKGDIADLILDIEHQDDEDRYFRDFKIIFYSEITEKQYKKLEGNVG